jgi:hypothetical protein
MSMFRPTRALLSNKATRLPLTSKHGNKDFYKGEHLSKDLRPVFLPAHTKLGVGTGSYPRLGPKRQGRHVKNHKVPYRLMDERMRFFMVPEDLDEPSNVRRSDASKQYISSS